MVNQKLHKDIISYDSYILHMSHIRLIQQQSQRSTAQISVLLTATLNILLNNHGFRQQYLASA